MWEAGTGVVSRNCSAVESSATLIANTYSSIVDSSISMTGMSSLIGYTR